MKGLIFLSVFFVIGCNNPKVEVQKKCDPVIEYVYRTDSTDVSDSLYAELSRYKSAYSVLRDSLIVQNYKINRVKFYLNICMKNPKQDKFLKGWVRRAVQ